MLTIPDRRMLISFSLMRNGSSSVQYVVTFGSMITNRFHSAPLVSTVRMLVITLIAFKYISMILITSGIMVLCSCAVCVIYVFAGGHVSHEPYTSLPLQAHRMRSVFVFGVVFLISVRLNYISLK